MPNPTPTVFVPYHAIDDLHARGTRALQPTAPNVTPGTLYCVTDEQKVERSNGTIWESYSSSTTLPTNIAYKDQANVFTENQTVLKVRPELILKTPGDTAMARFFSAVPGGRVDLAANVYFTGTAWVKDDITKTGVLMTLFPEGQVGVWTCAAGANPSTLVNTLSLSSIGYLTLAGAVISTGRSIINQGPHPEGYYGLELRSPSHIGIVFNETAAAVDTRKWRIHSNATAFYIEPLNDAENAVISRPFMLERSGNVTLGAAALVTGKLDLTGGVTGNYAQAAIEIRTAGTPRIGFHWPAVVASQIGMDSAGTIRTFDNPGTGYAAFSCGPLYVTGNIQSSTNTWVSNFHNTGYIFPGDASGPVQSTWFLQGHGTYGLYSNTGLGLAGGLTAGAISGTTISSSGNVNVGQNLHNTGGFIYPGRADSAGAIQASWYLGSHGSYGLWTNTGLYVEGPIYPGSIECRAHVRWVYGHYLTGGSAARAIIVIPGSGANFVPHLDNAILFGASDLRWYVLYTANGISTTSDLSTKKDLQPSTLGLAFLERLPVHRFQYIEDAEAKERIGFTVQDVEAVLAEDAWAQTVVIRKGEGPAGLNYLGFVPVLTTAVQELSARLRALEAKVNG